MFLTSNNIFNLSEKKKASLREILLLVVIFSAIIIPWLGLPDFSTRGEAREALVVKSMLESGNWILPKAYNDAIPSKPPMFHWIGALSSILFDSLNEFTIRFPSAIAAIGALAFFLFILKDIFDLSSLTLFSFLLTFSFEWLRASSSARVDMVHAASLSIGLLSAFNALERSDKRFWILATVSFIIAVLAKGPVAVVLPAMILFCWIITNPNNRGRNLLFIFSSLLVTVAISSLWYLAAYNQEPQEFLNTVWFENFERFGGSEVPHKHSVFYLFGMLIVGTLPWSIVVFWGTRKKLSKFPEYIKVTLSKTDIFRFSLLAASLIFVFYSIPGSKRSVYLLAAYPFLVILVVPFFKEYLLTRVFRNTFILVIGSFVAIQAIVRPLMVTPLSSERSLSNFVLTNSTSLNKLYSFGFEFYGASFYSGRQFLRFEDAFTNGHEPKINDRILSFDSDISKLEDFSHLHGKQLQLVDETKLDKRTVKIFRVI